MDSDDDYLPHRVPHERGVWSQEEHDKFLAAVALHPHGPWKTIAALVGTRSVRQVQTHAQKYHEKVNRRARGLQKNRQKVARLEHRVDDAAADFLQRPRGGKGQKRGKYNKRNRDARVAPIPPRRPRVASTATVPSTVTSTVEPLPSIETTLPVDTNPLDVTPLPPVVTTPFDEDEQPEVPLPSPSEVASPDLFTRRVTASPLTELLLDGDDLLSLTDDTQESLEDSRSTTPSSLLAFSAGAASPRAHALSAEAIDSMLYHDDDSMSYHDDDDIVAVEEAPEHALSIGATPSLNDALDYFLQVMTAWGPGSIAGVASPSTGLR